MSNLLVSPVDVQEQWTSWKEKYGKSYESEEEEQKRFEIFESQLQAIVTHNDRYQAGDETFSKALNQFADRTSDEVPKGCLLRK